MSFAGRIDQKRDIVCRSMEELRPVVEEDGVVDSPP